MPPQLDLFDDRHLLHMEAKSILSINGARVTDSVFRLLTNVPRFRIALRLVKHWAKRRGIYSNVFGYLGGISWEIMLAHVANLPENQTASAAVLLCKFWKLPLPLPSASFLNTCHSHVV